MPAIGLIDDRNAERTAMAKLIRRRLEKEESDWTVVDSEPLEAVADYPSYIAEKEIAVLIVDERLKEEIGTSGKAADYAGHDVIEFLKNHMPSLPLFVVTAHEDDEDLKKSESDVEDVINRDQWNDNYQTYVARFLRRGRTYVSEYENELSELAELSQKVASGTAVAADQEKLKAIQSKLSIAFPLQSLDTRDHWLKYSEQEVILIEEQIAKIKDKLQKK